MKQEKLESILDAAGNMFGRYGIQKTSLHEIAQMARVAKATIYNYFGSKDQVCAARTPANLTRCSLVED